MLIEFDGDVEFGDEFELSVADELDEIVGDVEEDDADVDDDDTFVCCKLFALNKLHVLLLRLRFVVVVVVVIGDAV